MYNNSLYLEISLAATLIISRQKRERKVGERTIIRMGEKTTCVRRRNIVVVERRRVAEWKDGQLCTGEPGVIISD